MSVLSRRAALLFLVLGIAWGLPYLLIKVSVEELSPAQIVLARTGLSAVVLLPVAVVRRAVAPVLARWRWLLVFTLFEIAIPWLLLGDAETRLSSSTTGLLVAALPLVSLVVAVVSGGTERLTRQGWVGLAVGVAGVAAVVQLDLGDADLRSVGQVGIVVTSYAIGHAVLSRQLSDLPGIGVVACALSLAALIYVPIVLGLDGRPTGLPSAKVVGAVVALALVCTAMTFVLLFMLVTEVGAVRASTITYLNPAVAVLAGALLLRERVTAWALVGLVLVVSGSYLVNLAGRVPGSGSGVRSAWSR